LLAGDTSRKALKALLLNKPVIYVGTPTRVLQFIQKQVCLPGHSTQRYTQLVMQPQRKLTSTIALLAKRPSPAPQDADYG
jgi:superfamily II DNA/RNA helicase